MISCMIPQHLPPLLGRTYSESSKNKFRTLSTLVVILLVIGLPQRCSTFILQEIRKSKSLKYCIARNSFISVYISQHFVSFRCTFNQFETSFHIESLISDTIDKDLLHYSYRNKQTFIQNFDKEVQILRKTVNKIIRLRQIVGLIIFLKEREIYLKY